MSLIAAIGYASLAAEPNDSLRGESWSGLRHDEPYVRYLESIIYPAGDINATLFPRQRIEVVPLSAITDSNQIGLNRLRLLEMWQPVHLIRDEHRLTVWDGNHRHAIAYIKGEEFILARVVDLGEVESLER